MTGGPVCRTRRALTQALEERGPRQEQEGGGEDLEEDEEFNIQVQQTVHAMIREKSHCTFLKLDSRNQKSAFVESNGKKVHGIFL